MSEQTIAEIAKRLTKAQRRCGDLLDSFPCVECGARGPKACPLPPSAWMPVGDLLNSTPGLGNHLRREVSRVRAHLLSEGHDHDRE